CLRTVPSRARSPGPGMSSTPRTSSWAGSRSRPRRCCAASTRRRS
ncbi:MAG: LSU ribosomal protein L13p (L13Ae), partial [uncultured Friedmanniella sp.]